jgi:hypothetical protein
MRGLINNEAAESVFGKEKTVETVEVSMPMASTQLKLGVNEKETESGRGLPHCTTLARSLKTL